MASKQLMKKSTAGAGQDGIKDPLIDAEEGLTEPFGNEPAPKTSGRTRRFWIVAVILAAVACAAVVAVGGAAFYLLRPPPPRSLFDTEHFDSAPPRKLVAHIPKPITDVEETPELSVVDTVVPKVESAIVTSPPSDFEPKVAVALLEELPKDYDVPEDPAAASTVGPAAAVANIDDGTVASQSDEGRLDSQGAAAASASASIGEASLWDDYFFGGDDEYRSYEADDELYQDGDANYFDDNGEEDYQMDSFNPFDDDSDDDDYYFDLYQDEKAVEVDESPLPAELGDGVDDAESFDKSEGESYAYAAVDDAVADDTAAYYQYDRRDDDGSDDADDTDWVESNDELQIADDDSSEWLFDDLDDYLDDQEEGEVKEDLLNQEQPSLSDYNFAGDDYSAPSDDYGVPSDDYAGLFEDVVRRR